MLERSTPWDRWLWNLSGLVKRPDQTVRWVKPGHVFGEQRLSSGGQVAKVFRLHRAHADAFRHEDLEPSDVAADIASNLFEEIPSPPRLAAAVGCYFRLDFVPEVGPMYDQIRQTCTAGLANAACYAITIPQPVNATLAAQLWTMVGRRSRPGTSRWIKRSEAGPKRRLLEREIVEKGQRLTRRK
jgi:hypothetical protein